MLQLNFYIVQLQYEGLSYTIPYTQQECKYKNLSYLRLIVLKMFHIS